MKKLPIYGILFALMGLLNLCQASDATPAAEVAAQGPSHEIWDQLLQKYVSSSGAVNYQGFLKEKSLLQTYLDKLSNTPPQSNWSSNEKLAYWINAYNAFTVKLIIDNFPLKSIRDLEKPWDTRFVTIGGKSYSLNDIEHNIIRKRFQEPRIHFAVNCASESCPPLLNTAYTSAKLNSQLDRQTRRFVNATKFNQLHGSQATLSPLFDWYKEDFTRKGSLVSFLNTYAKNPLQPDAKITFGTYDWNLND